MDKVHWFKNLNSIPQKKLRVQVVNDSIILVVIPYYLVFGTHNMNISLAWIR
jgi:hypothetical protein